MSGTVSKAQEEARLRLAEKEEKSRLIREVVNAELREIGIFDDYQKFASSKTPKEAFPILARHLKLESMPTNQMGMLARCFAEPNGHEYWDILLEKFEKLKDADEFNDFKQGLAWALGQACTTKEEIADVLIILEDQSYGGVRMLMAYKLKNTDEKIGLPLFQELCERLVETDPEVRPEILSWKAYWKRRNPALLEKWSLPKKASKNKK